MPIILTGTFASVSAASSGQETTSLNSEILALPASGTVVIDGQTDDWDLSAGAWSYNAPDIVETYSIWTHLMWDDSGVYYLARVHDLDPMKNATKGVDFDRGWRGDAVQLRVILDDRTPDEHQMHMTLYYSSPEQRPYLIVKHGGMRSKPPYDNTGPDRPDLLERFGETMEKAGGRFATKIWDDGRGYNMEAFMPWSYLRLNGKPLKPGESFVLGWETLWAKATQPGEIPDTSNVHRLADGVKDASANRIFMFRARNDWGRAMIAAKGGSDLTAKQRQIHEERLASLNDLSTTGSIPIAYELPAGAGREVTIAIDNAQGERVRNLFGQYPRNGGNVTDYWDGLDDAGQPASPGAYTATVLDHEPIKLELMSTLYNSSTPPWITEKGNSTWGSDHGVASAVATRGDQVLVGFSMPEAGRGLSSISVEDDSRWSTRNSAGDLVFVGDSVYAFEYDIWQKKFLITQTDPKTGRIVPFKSADGEQMVAREIPIKLEELSIPGATTAVDEGAARHAFVQNTSLAYGGGALWLLLPEKALFKIDPVSGDTLETRPSGSLLRIRSRDGKVYGIFNDKTLWSMTEDLKKGACLLNLSKVRQPGRFAISQDFGRLAVCDIGTNQVLVYALPAKVPSVLDARPWVTIGKPKPGLTDRRAGPFDRDDIMLPLSADFDSRNRLWVAEGTSYIHRTSVWNPDGSFSDDYWGACFYGATGGINLPHMSERFIGMGVEFQIDRNIQPFVRKSAEVPLYYHPHLNRIQGTVYRAKDASGREHEFVVTAPGALSARALVIYRRDRDGQFVPAAGLFGPIRNAVERSRMPLGDQVPESKTPFGWTDLNGDGRIDSNELVSQGVKFLPYYWSSGWVRPDMTILTPDMQLYALKEIDGRGVPVYDFTRPQAVPNPIPVVDRPNASGTPVIDRAGNISDGIVYHTVDGRRGAYPNLFRRHNAPAAQRGLLIAPFRTNGVVEDIPGIGSATMLQGDRGEWFMMSLDGLFVSSLFQDIKGVLQMNETLIGGESFGGHFWRVTDGPLKGKVLVQSGGTCYAIFEVKNLETIRRHTVTLNVSAEDIRKGAAMAAAGKAKAHEEGSLVVSKVSILPAAAPDPEAPRDAALSANLPFTVVEEQGNAARWFKVSLMTDGKELAMLWQVADDSPWKNGSDLFTHAFAGGDGVDLKFVSPRNGAARLMVAPLSGRPQAVYWQSKAPQRDNPQVYAVANNPANARSFDIVRVQNDARIDVKTAKGGYSLLIRVPLSSLGLGDLAQAKDLRGVAGVVFSDSAGSNRVARLYWHDKNTGMVNDIPTESAVEPDRMGDIEVKP